MNHKYITFYIIMVVTMYFMYIIHNNLTLLDENSLLYLHAILEAAS